MSKYLKFPFLKVVFLFFIVSFLYSCGNTSGTFLPGGNARENSPDPNLRVQKNLEEGRGFRLMDKVENRGGGNFDLQVQTN